MTLEAIQYRAVVLHPGGRIEPVPGSGRTVSVADRKAMAVHEAGHACAALGLGLPLVSVTIGGPRFPAGVMRGDGFGKLQSGICLVRVPAREWPGFRGEIIERAAAERHIMQLQAGEVAESIMGVVCAPGISGKLSDGWCIDRLSRSLADTPADRAERVRELAARIRAYLSGPRWRPALEAVAEALVARQYLSGADVVALVREARGQVAA